MLRGMAEVVRRSKITPPHLPAAPVARPRVNAVLDAAARKPVTLVSASAGYGKTVAVDAWLTARRITVAWVSVDAHDNDPLRLWRYVIAAVEHELPGFDDGPALRVRAAEGTAEPAIEALLTALAADRRPLTIVLDDLHELTDARALATVGYAAQRLPPTVRLLLLTRVDPPLRIARMRASGLLAEVRDADLAFTREEAAALLGAADSDALHAQCEGWPVALRLGALRGAGTPVTGRRRDVASYLTDEVLAALGDDVLTFLERSSVLPRLSAQLCDHVLEREDSAALLAEIARENLFIVSLDDEGRWFRYHALFAEFLRARLGPADDLHRRAAAWFEANELLEDAVEQAAAAREFDTIARLLEAHQLEMSRSGRTATIVRWLRLLPREMLTGRPEVLTAAALAAGGLARPRTAMRRVLAQAEQVRERQPEQWTGFHETARVLLAAVYGDDDVAATVAHAAAAVELAREHAEMLEAPALAMLAWAQVLAGEHDAAWAIAADTVTRADAADRPFGTVGALAVQATVCALRENAVMAERYAAQALHAAGRAGVLDSTAAGCAHFGAALGALAAGRPADAQRALRRAHRMAAAIEGGALHAWLCAVTARMLAARGRLAEAERALGEARAILDVCRDPGHVRTEVERAGEQLAAARAPGPTPAEPLSRAELAVLREFGDGRSAREIGAALYLSVNTVKTHIRAIYRKLGVSTREDALARAHALELVES